jgi:hypothetical protein
MYVQAIGTIEQRSACELNELRRQLAEEAQARSKIETHYSKALKDLVDGSDDAGGGDGDGGGRLEVGAKVEANYRGKGRYYAGTIAKENRDGTFDVDYNDGELERGMEAKDIRLISEGGGGDDVGGGGGGGGGRGGSSDCAGGVDI